jgi:hypothetical protein
LDILEDICGKSWGGDRIVMVSLYHCVNSSKSYNISFMYHCNEAQSITDIVHILQLMNSVPESGESVVYMKSWTLYSPCGGIFSVLIVLPSTKNSVTRLYLTKYIKNGFSESRHILWRHLLVQRALHFLDF